MINATEEQELFTHANFPSNPWKGGVINVSRDVPSLPRKLREEQERQAHKLLGLGGRL